MRVILQRAWSDSRATLGMLTIEGVRHDPFFTLENPLRAEIFDSRIPAGEYECVPYSGKKYQNVYLIRNVPGRTAILLHWGNFEKDTEGCILVGLGAGILRADPFISASKVAFEKFRGIIGSNNFRLIIKDAA